MEYTGLSNKSFDDETCVSGFVVHKLPAVESQQVFPYRFSWDVTWGALGVSLSKKNTHSRPIFWEWAEGLK